MPPRLFEGMTASAPLAHGRSSSRYVRTGDGDLPGRWNGRLAGAFCKAIHVRKPGAAKGLDDDTCLRFFRNGTGTSAQQLAERRHLSTTSYLGQIFGGHWSLARACGWAQAGPPASGSRSRALNVERGRAA